MGFYPERRQAYRDEAPRSRATVERAFPIPVETYHDKGIEPARCTYPVAEEAEQGGDKKKHPDKADDKATEQVPSRYRKIVTYLDEKAAPILDKPLRRIVVGGVVVILGILNILNPFIPGGVISTVMGVGIMFGVKPSKTADSVIAFAKWISRPFRKKNKKEPAEEAQPQTA